MSRRHVTRDEVTYKGKYVGTVEYRTSRTGYGYASLVAYRFECLVPEKTGPDFVLVHGIGVSARSYGPTAVELAQHGDIHLIDLAGYGRSPRPDRDLTIANHAQLVAQYLADHDLDHPVVVGHSMGTQVVAQLAADFSDEVDHIVLIAPVVAPSARSLPKAARLLLANGLKEPLRVSADAVYDYLFRAGVPYMIQQTRPHRGEPPDHVDQPGLRSTHPGRLASGGRDERPRRGDGAFPCARRSRGARRRGRRCSLTGQSASLLLVAQPESGLPETRCGFFDEPP